MLVSFIFPCYNDAEILPESLHKLSNFFEWFTDKDEYTYELIFVDDGSTDNTLSLLEQFQNQNQNMSIKIVHYTKNRGKWFAVKRWVSACVGDRFFFMDIDLATDLKEIYRFLDCKKLWVITIGSRVTSLANRTIYRKTLWKISNIISGFFLGLSLADTQCGFKFFEKEAKFLFKQLTLDGFSFDLELLLLAQQQWYLIRELDVVWNEWAYSHVKLWHYFQSFRDVLYLRKKY